MAFNPFLDGYKINMRSEFADTVTRKWTRAEVDNIMQTLVFDSNSSALAAEAMTLDAVDAEWMGEMMVLDSAVITTNMRTLNGKFTESISRTLTRKLSPDLSISGNEVGKVKKSGLYASIAAIFRVSDGQTVTIIFHAPDGDPKVIAQDDTLIAFRVLMNKTDITSHVLPQLISIKGVTSLDQVSTNIASLLKANSGTFTGKQAQIASQKKELEEKTAELRKLESAQAEAVQMEADAEQRMKDADEKGAGLESRIKRMEEDNAVLQEKIDKLKAKKAAEQVATEEQPNKKATNNKNFLDMISDPDRSRMLSAIAKQYGITHEEAYSEVTTGDAEDLFEYMVEPERSRTYYAMKNDSKAVDPTPEPIKPSTELSRIPSTAVIKSMPEKKYQKLYEKLGDENYHSLNLVLEARRHGDDALIAEAENMLALKDKLDSLRTEANSFEYETKKWIDADSRRNAADDAWSNARDSVTRKISDIKRAGNNGGENPVVADPPPTEQTNPHVATLRSIVSGDYDNKPLPEVETALFTAADALEATGLSDQYDDLIGKAAEKYAELDQKANG